jgi:hypothetical protein
VIWPWDTARGFRDIGYNPLIAGLAPFFIHTGMSLPTQVRTSAEMDFAICWLHAAVVNAASVGGTQ